VRRGVLLAACLAAAGLTAGKLGRVRSGSARAVRVTIPRRPRDRLHPLVDTFGHNPYPENAAEPPWMKHADPRTVGQADLDHLLGAIRAVRGEDGAAAAARRRDFRVVPRDGLSDDGVAREASADRRQVGAQRLPGISGRL
jgi:hypothetical protein